MSPATTKAARVTKAVKFNPFADIAADILRDADAELSGTNKAIADACADPYAFLLRYFGHRLRHGDRQVKNAQWQIDELRRWGRYIKSRDDDGAPMGERVASAWPRQFGKTTISRACMLWALLCGHRRFVVDFRYSAQLAEGDLADIMGTLEGNELLIKDFKLENWASIVSRKAGLCWNTKRLTFPNVNGDIVCIAALGKGSSPRGLEYRNVRPDLLWLDDVECTEGVLSAAERASDSRWMEGDLKNLGASALLMFTQTRIGGLSMMNACLEDKAWNPFRISALDDNDESTWPEMYPTMWLRDKRATTPSSVWIPDFENGDYNQDGMIPADSWRVYCNPEDGNVPIPQRAAMLRVCAGIDLAFSKSTASDYSAIVVVGQDAQGHKHLMREMRFRETTPSRIIDKLLALDAELHLDKLTIEDQTASKTFIELLKGSFGSRVAPQNIAKSDKPSRVYSIAADFEQRNVWRRREDTLVCTEAASFRQDMTHQHDDMLDAMVYAFWGLKAGGVLAFKSY